MSDVALLFGYFVISFTISRQYYRYQEACLKQNIDKLGQELEYQITQLRQEIEELREKEKRLNNLSCYEQLLKKEIKIEIGKQLEKMDSVTKSKIENIENQIDILKQEHISIGKSIKALTSHVSLVNNLLEKNAILNDPEQDKDKFSNKKTSWFGLN